MSRIVRKVFCLLVMIAAAVLAKAETGILTVKMLDLRNTPVRGIRVNVEEPGCVALGPADDRGLARIRLAPGIKPPAWITLELSSAQYAFVQPWDRRAQVPPFENESVNYLRVFVVNKGDRAALESGRFAVALAQKFNAQLAPKLSTEKTSEERRKQALADVASSYGLNPEETDRAIREYGKKAVDPFEKGVIAFYEKNYAEATAELSKSYDTRKAAIQKAQVEMVEVCLALGLSLYEQGRYRMAAEKLREANALREDDRTLTSLGVCLLSAGFYAEAEPLLRRALSIAEKTLGPENLLTATNLNNLAGLCEWQGKYAEAEALHKRALAIREKALGPEHPGIVSSLENLAGLYVSQGKYGEAEPLYGRALQIAEKGLGPEHPTTATCLNNLAGLYEWQGKYAEAERLYKRALLISEKVQGMEHPETAATLGNLARLCEKQGKYAEAEPLFKRALAVSENALGLEHPGTATILNNLAALYKAQAKHAEAEPLLERALAINEKALGPEHPETANVLSNLAVIYSSQGKEAQAEPLYRRALAIREKTLGPEHPGTATSLNNLAVLYRSQGKYAEAEPLFTRALAIFEKSLGSDHLDVATVLANYAKMLRLMNREDEAARLETRAKQIHDKAKPVPKN